MRLNSGLAWKRNKDLDRVSGNVEKCFYQQYVAENILDERDKKDMRKEGVKTKARFNEFILSNPGMRKAPKMQRTGVKNKRGLKSEGILFSWEESMI